MAQNVGGPIPGVPCCQAGPEVFTIVFKEARHFVDAVSGPLRDPGPVAKAERFVESRLRTPLSINLLAFCSNGFVWRVTESQLSLGARCESPGDVSLVSESTELSLPFSHCRGPMISGFSWGSVVLQEDPPI